MSAAPIQTSKDVAVVVTLTAAQARALAQLCKRLGWNDAMSMSVDEHEARLQIAATDRLRAALEDSGVYVR